jgi:integrase
MRSEGRWYFRRYVPPDVLGLVDLTILARRPKDGANPKPKAKAPRRAASQPKAAVWKTALRTSDERVAEQRARELAALTDRVIEKARARLERQRWLRVNLTDAEQAALDEAGGLEGLRAELNARRKGERFLAAGAEMLDHVAKLSPARLDAEGIDPEEAADDSASARALLRTTRQRLTAAEVLFGKASGEADAVSRIEDSARESMTLPGIITRWARDTDAPPQHVEQYEYPARRFREMHGDLPLAEITKDHLREFADLLMKLPNSSAPEVRKAAIHEAIRYGEGKGLPKLSRRTVSKHLTALGTLLGYAESWGYIPSNPASRLPILAQRTKITERGRRLPFTRDQMAAIVTKLEAEYPDHGDDYWIPLVAMYQGMRIEEVCQLDKTDLRQIDGTWAIDINDAGDKKLKNASSCRIIPLHPQLEVMGFVDHAAASPGPKLFATLSPDQRGRWGGPYGKRFARFLSVKAKIKQPGLTFHSFRHSWKDAARNAGLPPDVLDRIQGHQHGSAVSAGYGVGHSVGALAPWMAKVAPIPLPPP